MLCTGPVQEGYAVIFLETERLILRNLLPQDAETMFDYRNNEICARYQRGQTRDQAGIVQLIARRGSDKLSADAPCMVAVALKATGEMVGEIVVMPSERTFSLGYTFSYRHHRQGYAFEALSALMEMLHQRYPGWEFICFTAPENQPSMALLRKLGYRELGYLPARESNVFGKWTTAATEAEIARAAGKAE